MSGLIFIGLFGVLSSLAVAGFVPLLRIHDHPVSRSSHHQVTPTGGGLGIVLGASAIVLLALHFAPGFFDNARQIYLLGGLALCVAALGLFDDVLTVPSGVKFVLIGVLSLVTPFVTGLPQSLPLGPISAWDFPPLLAFFGAALWVFVVVNVVNFMDGSNGLMALCGLVISSGIALIGLQTGLHTLVLIGTACAAGIAGFLPYNFRAKAQLFSGDVGSLFLGYAFAISGLLLAANPASSGLLYAVPLLLLPQLADALLTMARRARYGENLLRPHRSHIYQRLIQAGASHPRVALRYAGLSALMIGAVSLGGVTGMLSSPAYFAGWVLLALMLYVWTAQRLRGPNSRD